MTARELCNYLIAVASSDYRVRISAFNHNGSNIIFTKFIEGTQLYNTNIRITYDVYNRKTCNDLVCFIAKHNLEDYVVVSPVRVWRVVNYRTSLLTPLEERLFLGDCKRVFYSNRKFSIRLYVSMGCS